MLVGPLTPSEADQARPLERAGMVAVGSGTGVGTVCVGSGSLPAEPAGLHPEAMAKSSRVVAASRNGEDRNIASS